MPVSGWCHACRIDVLIHVVSFQRGRRGLGMRLDGHMPNMCTGLISFLTQVKEWRSKMRREQRVMDRQIRCEL